MHITIKDEPISIDTAQKLRLEIHIIEAEGRLVGPRSLTTFQDVLIYDLVPVGLDLVFSDILELFTSKLVSTFFPHH